MPSYNQLFDRNLGVFTHDETKVLRNLTIAVVGVGGLGGAIAFLLARLGVKKMHIADPEDFEPSNINRQYGAYIDTLGKNKAEAVRKEILRINPKLHVNTWPEKISVRNIDDFLTGVDVIFDCLEFFELKTQLLVHQNAKKRKVWIFTSQGAIDIVSFTAFNPNGKTLVNLVGRDNDFDIRKAIEIFFPILPSQATPKKLSQIFNGERLHIPSHATMHPVASGLLVEEMINVIVRKNKPIFEAPNCLILDMTKITLKNIYRDRL